MVVRNLRYFARDRTYIYATRLYNPLNNLLFDEHDPNSLNPMEDLHDLSKILDNCKYYDLKKFNNLSK